MDKNKKYQILKYTLIFLLLLFAAMLWRAVDRAIFVKEASVWMVPIEWASLFFITFALAAVLIKEKYILRAALAVLLFPSLFFTLSIIHLVILALVFLFLIAAENRISDDLQSRIRISLGKNIRSGSTLLIFGLSLAIASQYYSATKDLAAEKYLPRFEVGKQTSGLTMKIVSGFLPQAKDLGSDELTVDQFLQKTYENQQSGGGLFSNLANDPSIGEQMKNLNPAERMMAENLALTEGRKQLSQIAGMNLKGSEKMNDVFSEVINKKINGYFMPNFGSGESSSLFSGIIAIIILLTAMSFGSFFLFLWIWVVKLIFFIFKQSGAISVAMVTTEKEVVE